MDPAERTRLLLRPPTPPLGDDERRAVVDGLRARLVGISGVAGARPPAAVPPRSRAAGRPVDIDRAVVGRDPWAPDGPPDGLAPAVPFRWRPTYVRRTLGLAVVAACADGRFTTPADAVEAVADAAVTEWRGTGWRTFHWEPWYDGLRAGARAVVLAEALTWATSVWCALEWPRLAPCTVIGGPDERAAVSTPVPVRLRARAEARVGRSHGGPAADGAAGPGSLVVVGSGAPGPRAAAELAFVALVGAVRASRRSVPSVVLGLWPDAGEERVVTVDAASLGSAVDRVAEVVRASLAAGRESTAGLAADPVATGTGATGPRAADTGTASAATARTAAA